jgi:hypothetical protein
LNNIILRKKNDDGSYDNGDFLFNNVDLYDGCYVNKILEISPNLNRKEYNIKLSLRSVIGEYEYQFKPSEEDGYYLVEDNHPGLKFYFTDKNKVKYLPDKNGVISLINVLSMPLDIIIHMIADKYTVSDIDEYIVLDDINLIIWSSNYES